MVKTKKKSGVSKVNPVPVVTRTQRKARKAARRATPFADAGEIAGDRIGKILGYPFLKGAGRWLGSGIGSILGSGDYRLMGPQPKYNVLMSDAQVPEFSTTRQTNVVCHREYLSDVTGTSAFNLTSLAINPGLVNTFPWLSTVAENYQEYRFHGVVFEFKPLITDFVTGGAPGVVIMATNYNADAPLFNTKQEMENSEYAVATKPTLSLIHGIECDETQTILPERFVRTGAVPSGQDLRLYDRGNFQIATQGNPTQLLGELWVSYCVEFFKPILPATTGGNISGVIAHRTGGSNANPLGTSTATTNGTLGLSITNTILGWLAQPGTKYQVLVTWVGAGAVVAFPTITLNGLAGVPGFAGGVSTLFAPQAGSTATNMTFSALVLSTNTGGPAPVSVAFGVGGVLPGTPDISVEVIEVDSSLFFS